MTPNLYQALLEKYTRTRDDHILEYAFWHYRDAYYEILRLYFPERYKREHPHKNMAYNPAYHRLECPDCGFIGTTLAPDDNADGYPRVKSPM